MKLSQPELRDLVNELLKSDADLDAFCSDYVPEARSRFSDGMDRVRKTVILLDYADHQDLTARLLARRAARGAPSPASTGRVRILFLAANPSATGKLDIGREIRQIEERIGAGRQRDAVELIPCWAARPGDLQRELLEARPHILHFSGHGKSDRLVLEERDGPRGAEIGAAALVDLVGILQDNLRLVVLNACRSESLAAALVQHIECAVGMSKDIEDEAAIEFSAALYQAIAFGRSIDAAFRLGCNALRLKQIPEDQTPRLKIKAGADAGSLFLAGVR
jgi:CHAT domain